MPKFITKSMHAYLDYPVALALIVLPLLLGLGGSHVLAFSLSVATGIAALILTVLTDHQFGLVKVLPFNLHLAVDALVGIAFVLAPFAFGFSGLDAAYYWVLGGTVLAVVGMHKPETAAA